MRVRVVNKDIEPVNDKGDRLPHSLHRIVELLATAVVEMDEPQCLTPARCMMRHGPHCRVSKWNALVEAVKQEWAKHELKRRVVQSN